MGTKPVTSNPTGTIYPLAQLIDIEPLRSLLEAQFAADGMPVQLVDDPTGAVIAAAGEQQICAGSHRLSPYSSPAWRSLSEPTSTGVALTGRCEHGFWYTGLPVIAGDRPVGRLLLGPYLHDDELPPSASPETPAREAAIAAVPRFSRAQTEKLVQVGGALATFVGHQAGSYSRQRLELERLAQEQSEQEAQFSRAMDAVSDSLWDYFPQTGQGYFSPLWYTMLGYQPHEIPPTYDTFVTIVHPADREETVAAIQRHIEAGTPFSVEFRALRKDGRIIWIRSRGRTVEWDDMGRPYRALGTHTNITLAKTVADSLRRSELRFRRLFEQSPLGVAIHELVLDDLGNAVDYIITAVNPAYTKILGIEEERVVGRRSSEAFGTDTPPYLDIYAAVARGGGPAQFETFFEPLAMHFRVAVCAGEPDSFVTIFDDITEFKMLLDKLRRSEGRFRTLVEQAGDAVYVYDSDLRLIDVNRQALDMLGYSREELLGTPPAFVERESSTDQLAVAWVDLKPGQVVTLEAVHFRKDDSSFPVEVRVSTLEAPDGSHLLMGLARDITTRRQYEADLQTKNADLQETLARLKEAQAQLVQQERLAAVGQLAAGIAHDFNNLLTSMIGFAELLRQSPETPAAMRATLANIVEPGQRAAHLVRQILDFSGKSLRRLEHMDLALLVADTMRYLKPNISPAIEVELLALTGRYYVEADRAQLRQILINMVANAGDAMPDGGILRIAVETVNAAGLQICMGCGKPITGEWLRLSVQDTGQGIPAELLPRLFEPFFTTKEVGASGLGLSQALGVVVQHKGHITVSSNPGEGSNFSIYLPPASGQAPVAAPQDSAPRLQKAGHPALVLLIEQDTAVQEVGSSMLSFLGYQVLVAATGQAGLALYQAHRPEIELILSDVMLADMTVTELLRQLREQNPAVKVVLMSGFPLTETKKQNLKQDVAGWLEKPVTISLLSETLYNALKE
jgi:two-component system cell cycle sensor histidine kinase/response regulator CckA